MQKMVRMGAAALAATALASGCAEQPPSAAGPPAGAAGTPVAGPAGAVQGPPVTAEEAQATALEAVGGGWVLETKIEERDDDPDDDQDRAEWGGDDDFEPAVDVWEVTVVGPDGLRHRVSVDLTGGSVLDDRVDD